jgi:hypothetical protein
MSWREKPAESKVYVTGDIRQVIYSRADVLFEVPPTTHGLGALSAHGVKDAGEGIAFRGRTVLTPPNSDAGTRLTLFETLEGIAAPFFIGWTGEAAGVGRFHSEEGISLYEIYESLFEQAGGVYAGSATPLVFTEIVGLLRPRDIHDRALMRSVDTGNVLTTSPEYASEYYKTRIILGDLLERGLSTEEPVAVCLVGAGYDPQLAAGPFRDSCSLIFYTPPALAGAPSAQEPARIKTHSHALGWRGQPALRELLLSDAPRDASELATPEFDERLASSLPATTPDYIVHLDDWSVFMAGVVRVFITPADKISFNSTMAGAG